MNAELHFLYCGNGDTILVRAGEEWGIVDCNLTKSSGARKRLDALLEKHKVKHLRFVCVTHYDTDHLRGMADLLKERFSEDLGEQTGRRRWFVEQLIQPIQAKDTSRALALLQEATKTIHQQKIDLDFSKEALAFLELTKQMLLDGRGLPQNEKVYLPIYPAPSFLTSPPFTPNQRLAFGPFEVCFLSPEQDAADSFEADAFYPVYESLLNDPEALRKRIAANDVSRVIAFRHIDTNQTILLGADAPAESWPQILKRWTQICNFGLRTEEKPKWTKFHMVKVSHHGARDSHYQPLYSDWTNAKTTIAVVSSRSLDPKHPHPDVLKSLMDSGVQIEITGDKGESRKRLGKGPLIGKRPSALENMPNDICIRLTKGKTALEIERIQVAN